MAKTIKFNLICDEKPIRTIEDLRNNFSIEDILEYYNNQLLHRWLYVRGYRSELSAVASITSKEPMQIIKELIRIFDVATDEKKVEEDIYILKYLNERKKSYVDYERENYATKHIIADYEEGYRRLVDDILKNPDDVAIIKANINEIVSNYAWIFRLNHRNLFYILQTKSILAIMCLLMNEKSRNYYLPVEISGEDTPVIFDIEKNADKKAMFNIICDMIKQPNFSKVLGENLIGFGGITDGYWKDLEPKGKKYMIISMGDGDYVRSAGNTGGDLSRYDILNKFVILDGVDYKSNSFLCKVLYMEV